MRNACLDIINEEHQALSTMLRSLSMLLAQARRERHLPDFGVLRAMLFYVDEFPERLHHRKETELLFPVVRERCPELAPVLDRLDRDHANGEKAIRELEHALLAFDVMGEPRRVAFEQAVERYIRFYLDHMRVEEEQILPAARRCLTEQDWAVLDQAFSANMDPLTGHPAGPDYAPLFRRIVLSTPVPVGLEPAG